MNLRTIHFICCCCLAPVSCCYSPAPAAAAGETRRIEAKALWNDTGITLRKGRNYRFEVSGTWTDWLIRCDAAGPVSSIGRALMSPTRGLLRYPPEKDAGATYFTLIGTIGRTATADLPPHAFVIRDGVSIVAPATGTLHVFANDAPFAYGNNCGALLLEVKNTSSP